MGNREGTEGLTIGLANDAMVYQFSSLVLSGNKWCISTLGNKKPQKLLTILMRIKLFQTMPRLDRMSNAPFPLGMPGSGIQNWPPRMGSGYLQFAVGDNTRPDTTDIDT